MARRLFAYGKAVATPDGTHAILIESRGRGPAEPGEQPDQDADCHCGHPECGAC